MISELDQQPRLMYVKRTLTWFEMAQQVLLCLPKLIKDLPKITVSSESLVLTMSFALSTQISNRAFGFAF